MISEDDADGFAKKLAAATRRVVDDYRLGDVYHEEPFSDQLCGRLKETLHDFATSNISWQVDVAKEDKGSGRLRARSLTKTKEEPEFGADIVMALDVVTASYEVQKGFLAQSKRLERGSTLSNAEHRRLLGQCERMLAITPCSMVFLYGKDDVAVFPATAVLGIKNNNIWDIVSYPIEILYRDFAICWFGDPRLKATDHVSLEGLRLLVDAPDAIRFVGRQVEEPEAL